jgi:hypothetical protein
LSELPWDDLRLRLLLAALRKIRRMIWMGRIHGQVPVTEQAAMAEDAIQTAYEKFWSGKRRHWDWCKSDFRNFWGAVSSEISNSARSAENARTSRIDDDEKVVQFPTPEPGPDRRAEWLLMREQLLRFLRAEDGKVAQMAEIMLDRDLSGSKELAEATRLTPQAIDAMKKKLRRLVKKFLGDADEDHPEAAE